MITSVSNVNFKQNYYLKRDNRKTYPANNNVNFTGVPISEISPVGFYMEKVFARFRKISRIRRQQLLPELSKDAKFLQLKSKKSTFEVLDINPNNSDKYMVFFHGIGQNVTSNQEIYKNMIDKGYGVLASEYGGFGNSTGKISRSSIKKTVGTLMNYLEGRGIKRENIGVVGFSMGSFPSLELASKQKDLKFLVLISPFNSFKSELPVITNGKVAKLPKVLSVLIDKFPYVVTHLDYIFKTKFNIRKTNIPVYLIHSADDKLVPVKSTKELAKHAKNLREFKLVESGGHNIEKNKLEAFDKLKEFGID